MRFFSLALVVLMLGCSSSDDGNRGQGGESGSSSGRVCVPGSTQTCVGPGACDGGQSCAFDGSGWGPCDCGSGGTSSGSGGTGTAGTGDVPIGGSAGSGAVSGASGQSGAGTAGTGTAGTGGTGGTAGTAGTGAGGNLPDSACPTSGTCEKCCDKNHPTAQSAFTNDLIGCACVGACAEQCAGLCSTGMGDAVCNECLNTSFKDKSCTYEECTSADCQAFSACVLSCP